jgi:myo-inositol 2-dehydrogenase / D-chiro-inositol 1-dehydrogenase
MRRRSDMVRVGLIGAGRIGKVHAISVGGSPKAQLKYVYDVYAPAAEDLAAAYGAEVASVDRIMEDPEIDLVMICSSTETHADLIERSAKAGKAIFCEKPIDLDIKRVEGVLNVVKEAGAKLMVGFNRRFDPNFMALKKRLLAGDAGNVELVTIISRDPGAPPVDYLKGSGGLFRDMTIHDFDMARWLLDEEPTQVYASAATLTDPEINKAGDVDTAVVTLTCPSGRMAVITNSRRASYGYDQRIEVHGSKGMLAAGNVTEHTVAFSGETGVVSAKPMYFFLERYAQAYQNELATLIDALEDGTPVGPGGDDGLRSLRLADAAFQSLETGAAVQVR